MEAIQTIIEGFKEKLIALGFAEGEITEILYQVVLIASAKLTEQDSTFLSEEEIAFVSNQDVMQLSKQQLQEVTGSSDNLVKYLNLYAKELAEAITEFDKIVDDVRETSAEPEKNNDIN